MTTLQAHADLSRHRRVLARAQVVPTTYVTDFENDHGWEDLARKAKVLANAWGIEARIAVLERDG